MRRSFVCGAIALKIVFYTKIYAENGELIRPYSSF